MARKPDRIESLAASAAEQAVEMIDGLPALLLTHIPDADLLDLMRPEETSLPLRHAINRAVAAEVGAYGLPVFVQVADRAAFRRWMDGREDTPATRRAWIDRKNLLSGAAAMKILGLPAPRPAPRLKFPTAPGPTADRLLAAYEDEESPDFDELAEALIEANRMDVLDLALRKLDATDPDENEGPTATDLSDALRAIAEGARLGPSYWADLAVLPVALPSGQAPDAEAIAESFLAAGFIPETTELRFLPGWRNPKTLAGLDPGAIRRVLHDLVAGREPKDLPPGDTDDLARGGFALLIALRIDWNIPVWDELAVSGLPELPDEDTPQTPEEKRNAERFDAWRSSTFQTQGGCVPLALVPPSELADEIEDFLADAQAQTQFIEEIRDFIAVAQAEAGGETITGRIALAGKSLELHVHTESGRYLDTLTLPPERLEAGIDEMAEIIGSLIDIKE